MRSCYGEATSHLLPSLQHNSLIGLALLGQQHPQTVHLHLREGERGSEREGERGGGREGGRGGVRGGERGGERGGGREGGRGGVRGGERGHRQ